MSCQNHQHTPYKRKKERKKERTKAVCLRSRFSSFLVKSSFIFFSRQFLRSSSVHLGVEFLSVIPFHSLLLVHRERYTKRREEKRREEKRREEKRRDRQTDRQKRSGLVLGVIWFAMYSPFFSLSLACVEFLLKI
jgi:hypothetical protein